MGWALQCLEPEDEAFVAAHLPECSLCARTVARAEEVGAAMALALPQLEPPAELRHRILATAKPSSPSRAQSASVPTPVITVSIRRGIRLRGKPVLVEASALLVAVTVGIGVSADQLDSERDELASQRDAASTALSQVLDGMADPGLERTALATVDGSPMAVGLTRDSDASVTVVPVHLPANRTANETYVSWGLAGRHARALMAFDVTNDRTASFTRRSEPTATFAVSLEPGREVPTSPTHMVASGAVAG